MPRNSMIQVRRDSAAQWTSVNPLLAGGEFGFELDTGKLKCGDGSLDWVDLGYIEGEMGPQGPQGEIGPQGATGATGPGVAAGGTAGQVLAKNSATDFDTEWVDQTGGGGISGSGVDNFLVRWNGTLGLDSSAVSVDDSGQVVSTISDAATITRPDALTLRHITSGVPGAGFGLDVKFQLQTTASQFVDAGYFCYNWIDATHTTRRSRFYLATRDALGYRAVLGGSTTGTEGTIGFLNVANNPIGIQAGDAGTALVAFGLMSGTPTFDWANVASKPTTLAGYGITDAATDTELATAITNHEAASNPHPQYLTAAEGNAAYAPISTTQYTDENAQDAVGAAIAGGTQIGMSATYDDAANAFSFVNTDRGSTALASHSAMGDPHPQYLTAAEGNAAYSAVGHSHAFADLTSKPTTLAGYGITDGATDTEVATAINNHEAASDPHPQYLTVAEGNAAYAAIGHTHSFASLTSKPTTLAGYGITDAQLLDADLTAIAALTGTNTIYYRSAADTWTAVTIGTGLDFTGGTLSSTGGYTNEQAQDAVGGILTDSNSIELAYVDATPSILANVLCLTGGSLQIASGGLALKGDTTSPEEILPNQLYGTNASGTKGWYAQPALPTLTTAKLLGRGTGAGDGPPVEIAPGTGLEIIGTTLFATGGVSLAQGKLMGRGGSSGTGAGEQITPDVGLGFETTNLRLYPRGYVDGLALGIHDINHSITIAPGIAADIDTWALMHLPAIIVNKSLNGTWVAGSNQGGLDTGAKAVNTWYHIWLIRNPTTNTTDVLQSVSATSPTMPSGYTQKRRIGAIRVNASNQIVNFKQYNDLFLWQMPINDVYASALNNTQSLYAMSVPSGVRVWCELCIAVYGVSANIVTAIRPPDVDAFTSSLVISEGTVTTQGTNIYNYLQTNALSNTSSQVRVCTNGNITQLFMTTRGWRDPRGSDS